MIRCIGRERNDSSPVSVDTKFCAARIPDNSRIVVPLLPQSGREDARLQFTVAADDPNTDTLTYSVVAGLPIGAVFNSKTGQFQWTPGFEQAGDYTVQFQATDPGKLTSTLSVSMHVDNVDRPPVLTVNDHQVLVGQPFVLNLLASDPDLGTAPRTTSSLEGAWLTRSSSSPPW